MSDLLGFTAGKPPEWDVERFLRGDEVETALITLERNRRTFAWKCADVDAEGMALRLASASVSLGGLLKHLAGHADLLRETVDGSTGEGPPDDFPVP